MIRRFPQYSCSLDSQISFPACLIFATHHTDIRSIPARQRAPTGGACWRSRGGACGFGLVSQASGVLGRHRPAQLRGSVRQRAGGSGWRRV